MTDIEIPYAKERSKRYRFFEILPGFLSWSILLMPFVISIISPTVTVLFIIAYILMWFIKSLSMNIRVLQGYRNLQQQQKLPWSQMLEELRSGKVGQPDRHIPTWHYENIKRLHDQPNPIKIDNIIHAIFVAAYNESREILEPTVQALLACDYDPKKIILVMAYEERNGAQSEGTIRDLLKEYGPNFRHVMAVKHPADIPGEVVGKGAQILGMRPVI